tara:strand:- start:44 stop:151 length:108 start_codon:yes stop_codon:yes gene_type:complete
MESYKDLIFRFVDNASEFLMGFGGQNAPDILTQLL